MNSSIVLGLMQNIAILLTFSMLYDYFWSRNENSKNLFFRIGAGIVLGGIGIVLILTPWHFVTGIFFDTRSVMLSISGLFFGPIATLTAMAITGIFRWNLGGSGALMGIAVVFTSGSIGILWNYFRPEWHKKNSFLELTSMGILVHIVMICCTVFLPSEVIWETLKSITLPTMLIYPVGTVLLGTLLLNYNENWENRKALNSNEKRFRSIIDQATDAIFITDLEGNILDTNQQACKNLGYSMNELLMTNISDLDTVYNKKEILMDVFQKLNINDGMSFETEHRRKDQSTFPVEVNAGIIELDGYQRIIGFVRNVSERKQAEEKLKQERMLLRTLIDNLPVTIYVKDAECRKIIANRLDLDFMGVESEVEVLGKTDYELFDNEIAKRGYEDDLRVISSGQPVINREENFSDASGSERWLLTSKVPIYNENGKIKGLVGIGRDITEQKMAQEKILKLSKGIEQSSSTIVITDLNGNIEYVNPSFTQICGYSEAEAIGQNPRLLKSGTMPPEIYIELWNTIRAGKVWRGELQNKKKDGSLYWEWATITAIRNDKGIISNYIAIKEDISERKKMQAELMLAIEKAEESDRLKSAFLANMSHEIRTPLNSIIGFSELLGDPDFEPEQRNEFIKTIIENGNSLLVIISDIMDFSMLESRQMTIRNETFSTKKILNELMNDFRNKANQNGIQLLFDESFNQSDIQITSDYYRIKQIFSNLISNAIKFTHQGYIEFGYKPVNEFIEFHVKDTGIGIAQEYHQAIFDRFRQVDNTKTRKYGGNGLGLAITKNLVELLGGTIWVKSQPDKYSDFFFTIPVTKF